MAPKFRGNEEDWLDDEKGGGRKGSGHKPKKAQLARSTALPLESANATISEVFPKQCRVKMDEDQREILCSYRRAEVVSKGKPDVRERTPVAVGDRVLAKSTSPSSGVIEGLCVRKNYLVRPAPGREANKIHHVLAANVDLLVVVASAQDPIFSVGLVDRFLVAAQIGNIEALLCITKMDLWDSAGEKPWQIYQKIGYGLYEVCSKSGQGLEQLLSQIKGKTVVFSGHSGVGKTSLLRVLLKSDIGKVGEVNKQTGKGRHTTTGAVLLGGPDHSQWIDTPGIREFGLVNIEPEQLAFGFPEFKGLECSKKGCLHLDEENCAAKELPRYPSYRRILLSVLSGEN